VGLFDVDSLPEGFHCQPDFISRDEERELEEAIARIEFSNFEMRGVVARRRVAFFGASYDEAPALPIPEFLAPLRGKAATWAGVAPEAFAMALINEYTPGATIGWHRDAPQYDIIAGVSLLSACRMRLRPYVSPSDLRGPGRRAPRKTTHEITLAPRSSYLIQGLARSGYEHSIPATKNLRYSITFRTFR
jgi:alkylated DNA repair dioxygenase AlkB